MNASADADGILRRMPQIVELGGEIYPSLALATAQRGPGRGAARRSPTPPRGGRPSGSATARSRSTPTGACSCASAARRGPSRASRRSTCSGIACAPGGARGRIVFVGVAALGLGDMVATPLGTFLPGAEVHATVADNLLQGDFIRRPAGGTVAELAARPRRRGRGGPLGPPASGGGGALPLALGGALLLWLGVGWLLGARGWYLSPLFPTLALAGALGLAALHRLVAERARADQSNRQLRTAREMVLHALTSLTETRDFETGAHLVRTQPLRRGRSARRSPRTRSSGASSRRRRSISSRGWRPSTTSARSAWRTGRSGSPDRSRTTSGRRCRGTRSTGAT